VNATLVAAGLILLAGIAVVGISAYQRTAIAQTNAARDVAIHGQDVQLSIAHETKASTGSQILGGIGSIVKSISGPLGAIL
jgi:hypothetical protein